MLEESVKVSPAACDDPLLFCFKFVELSVGQNGMFENFVFASIIGIFQDFINANRSIRKIVAALKL